MSDLKLEATRAEDKMRSEERRETERRREHEKQLESIRAVAASPVKDQNTTPFANTPIRSIADELLKLADLRDKGVITPVEFEQQKRILLSSQTAA